jgi:protease-4
MRSFFKTFFASFLALVVFCILGMFLFAGFMASLTSRKKTVIPDKTVLVLDLSVHYKERTIDNPFAAIISGEDNDQPTLYDMTRMIRYAASDSSVKGIYILCGSNANGYAATEELREAVKAFRASHKFVIAYGEAITQKGYYLGSAADKIYCHPQGGVDWSGFSANLLFLKGTLDKLEIQPQVFYAGKFKSATEPLRETRMTDANRLQTSVWLGGLYSHFLQAAAESRKMDTAVLHSLASTGAIQTAHDALRYHLVDGLKYDDEIKKEIATLLGTDERKQINFITFSEYANGASWRKADGGKIALIFADGDIVSGKSSDEQVGSDEYKNIIRKARMDKDVKAIVLRVNSPGGSSLASDVIWREVALARKEKPVVISMGDVAASGGYYISCNADSVFANANSITGSIGVFSVLPNMEPFFRNKLGITFDGVKTAPHADLGSISRPLTEPEKRMVQAAVDSIYGVFITRVADGRKKSRVYIDSIAQGRVWTGSDGLKTGLVDRIGTLQDAMDCAARMARLKEYRVKEYPEKKNFLEQLMNNYRKSVAKDLLKTEIGVEQTEWLRMYRQVKQMTGEPQMRLPFTYSLN